MHGLEGGGLPGAVRSHSEETGPADRHLVPLFLAQQHPGDLHTAGRLETASPGRETEVPKVHSRGTSSPFMLIFLHCGGSRTVVQASPGHLIETQSLGPAWPLRVRKSEGPVICLLAGPPGRRTCERASVIWGVPRGAKGLTTRTVQSCQHTLRESTLIFLFFFFLGEATLG